MKDERDELPPLEVRAARVEPGGEAGEADRGTALARLLAASDPERELPGELLGPLAIVLRTLLELDERSAEAENRGSGLPPRAPER